MYYCNYSLFKIKRLCFYKKLLIKKKAISGRSALGNIILFGRGGSKYSRFYRLIDFKRFIVDIPALIIQFEYDPNRNCFIMLLLYYNGIITYMLGINLLKKNMIILNQYRLKFPFIGYGIRLYNCIVGSFINSMKLHSLTAKFARAGGTYIQIVRKFGNYSLLRLPSKEERFCLLENLVVIGRVSGEFNKLLFYTSAGIRRLLGFRPKVRGTARNPVDHPHGGAGRTPTGMPSVSYWGLYTKGVRTTTRFKRKVVLLYSFYKRRSKELF